MFLPALVELQKQGRLTAIEECWGTSAGALIASLFYITRDSQKVKDIMFKTDFTKFRDVDITNILSIDQSWGLDDGKNLILMIEQMFEDAGINKSKTMSDVPGVHIVVSDLTLNKTVVLNAKTYPDLRLVEAIRASMSLPFFLRPYISPNGHIWVDGALKYNFPWLLLPNDKARRSAIGFAFKKQEVISPKSLSQYIFSIINFNDTIRLDYSQWPNIIVFLRPEYPSWYVKFKEEDYAMVIEQGEKTIQEWLNDSKCPLRNSENLSPSADRYTPLQVFPQHRTGGLSDNPILSHEPIQGSSPPRLPYTPQSYRRWSV